VRDYLTYLRYTLRIMLRDDAWSLVIPCVMLIIVGAWTGFFVEVEKWKAGIAVTQAEVFGPFCAAFLFAALLAPEQRQFAGEIIYSKPHSAVVLLGTRMAVALAGSLLGILVLLLFYQLRYQDAEIPRALAAAVPPCLFIGSIALTATLLGRTAAVGYAVPLGVWFWDSTAGMIYNPLFVLPASAMEADAARGGFVAQSALATRGTLLLATALLFWFNVRQLKRNGA
jgi:hypothetical protein